MATSSINKLFKLTPQASNVLLNSLSATAFEETKPAEFNLDENNKKGSELLNRWFNR